MRLTKYPAHSRLSIKNSSSLRSAAGCLGVQSSIQVLLEWSGSKINSSPWTYAVSIQWELTFHYQIKEKCPRSSNYLGSRSWERHANGIQGYPGKSFKHAHLDLYTFRKTNFPESIISSEGWRGKSFRGSGCLGSPQWAAPPVSAALADPDHSAPLRSSPGNTSYSRRQRRPLPHLPLKQLFYFWLTLFWANPPESSCLKGNCSWQISCFFLCAAVVIQSLSHHPLTGIFIAWLFSLLLLWFCVVWFS